VLDYCSYSYFEISLGLEVKFEGFACFE